MMEKNQWQRNKNWKSEVNFNGGNVGNRETGELELWRRINEVERDEKRLFSVAPLDRIS